MLQGHLKASGEHSRTSLEKRAGQWVGVARSKDALDGLQVDLGSQVFIPRVREVSSASDVQAVSEGLRIDGAFLHCFS